MFVEVEKEVKVTIVLYSKVEIHTMLLALSCTYLSKEEATKITELTHKLRDALK